jgi:hypothetical protein
MREPRGSHPRIRRIHKNGSAETAVCEPHERTLRLPVFGQTVQSHHYSVIYARLVVENGLCAHADHRNEHCKKLM